MSLLDRISHAPLLADGALGTLLHLRGAAPDRCFEELNLSQPDLVAALHREYVEAGADLVLTNTFGANRYKLAAHGLEREVEGICAAAVALARQAAGQSAKQVLVAGDVGPLGVRLAPFGRVQAVQARAAFAEPVQALAAAGVNLLVLETFSDLREIAEAVRAAKEIARLPVVATMSFTRDDRTLLGETPAAAAGALLSVGADVVGVNCSGGPAQAMRILRAMKQSLPQARFAVKPNAGWPEQVGGRIIYPATPEYFAQYAVAFAAAGAGIIGGCCGTTPQHIAAMRAALDRRPPSMPPAAEPPLSVAAGKRESVSAAEPTRLARRLATGKFIISVEMDPPRGLSTHRLLAGAQLLADVGADAINVADSPMARMRMSAWAVCHLIQREVGVETVLHFPTRGRNLLRVQGDLLAAHALGLRNVFVVMGDPTTIGDYPTAMNTYDVVPSGLIKLIKQGFNAGVDHAGATIGQPTSFFVGCAVNLGAPDLDRETRALNRKIMAGADFALTQPVYEASAVHNFFGHYEQRYGPLRLPLLAGVLPLYSARHAAFLHNEVPGITIPEILRQRIAAANNAAAEGIRIASDLLAELQPLVQGVYLMPPFGRYDMAAEIIDRVTAAPSSRG